MAPNPYPWLDLAAAFIELDQVDNALYACRNAVRVGPEHAEAHHRLGVVLTRLDRDDEACEAFGRAIALDPLHTRARLNYATLVRDRAPSEARMHLAVLYRQDPDMANLLALNLGAPEEAP